MPIEKTPNFIRIRVADPNQFVRFRIKLIGKGIRAVIGFLKAGGSRIQSLLFPKSRFTLASAKAWVKKHGYTIEESYWVTDIIIDPETKELVLEEVLATDEEEEIIELKTEEWALKMSEDDIQWLMKE